MLIALLLLAAAFCFIMGMRTPKKRTKKGHDPLGMPLGDSQQDILEGLKKKYGKR